MFRYLRFLSFALFIIGLYFFWEWGAAKFLLDSVHPPATVSVMLVGQPAPELKVPKQQIWSKQEFSLAALKGYPVILHFWATWCAPCVQELPELLDRTKQLRAQGFSVITVAVDESWQKLESFFVRYPHLAEVRDQTILILDPKGEIAERFGSNRFPETFLINTKGLIDNILVGPQPWKDRQLDPYLERLRAPAKASN